MQTYEYIIKLTDQMSGTMQKVAGVSDTMVNKLEGMTKKQRELDSMSKSLGGSISGLKQKIDLLQQEKDLIDPSNLDFIKAYNKEISSLEGQLQGLENTGKSTSFIGGLKDHLGGLINPATIAAGIMAATGKSALEFERGMSEVNITAQLDGKSYEELQRKIADVAKDNKAVIEIAPQSFNQIISQTGDAALSLEILDAAMKGSRAASVDMTTVSAALAQSLSVIGKEADALDVLDTFLTSKRVGAGEFEDFARYLPTMIAGASNLGIHYKEVAGVFAYMTGKGQSAEKAAVLIENAFSALGKGNIRDNLKKAGVDVFDETGKIRGLVDIFGDLTNVMGTMSDEQKSTFLEKVGIVDKEAKNSFALLTADLDKFSNSMNETKNSTGETDRALQYSENGLRRAGDLWTKLRNIGFEFGRAILPVIHVGINILGAGMAVLEPVLGAVTGLFDWWFSGLAEGNPLVWGLTAGLTAATVALNAATIAAKAKAVIDGVVAIATKGWTAAQWLLNSALYANPVTWIIAGIAALVAIIVVCVTKVEGWGKQWDVIVNFMGNVFDLFVESFKFQWDTLINGLMIGLDKIKLGWYKFKEAVGLGDSGENNAMITQLNEDVEQRKRAIVDGARKIDELRKKTASSLTWELSWKDGEDGGILDSIQGMIPGAPAMPPGQTVDYDELMKNLEKSGGNGKGKGNSSKASDKTDRIDLNETVANMKGTGSYSAIVSKLNPVRIASLSAKVAASAALPALLTAGEVPQTTLPEFETAKTEYVDQADNKPIAVRIVDLSGSVLSKLPQPILKSGDPVIAVKDVPPTFLPEINTAKVGSIDPVAAVKDVPPTFLPEFNVNKADSIDPVDSRRIAGHIADLSGSMLSKLPQPILKGGDPVAMPDVKLNNESQATALPSVSEITTNNTEIFHETERTDKGIRMERFCDQIVIHIAEANGKGADEIKSLIMDTVAEMMDDYGA
jgi:TP901 family phage tail tape measure protein